MALVTYYPKFSIGTISPKKLSYLIEALILIDIDELNSYPSIRPLYQSNIKYEVSDDYDSLWQDVLTTLEVGTGDCKVLTAWRIAEERRKGNNPQLQISARYLPDGKQRYHVYMYWPRSGQFEDPSIILGMIKF